MQILEPNTGEENIFIPKEDVYVYMTDYGKVSLLIEVETVLAQQKYIWFSLNRNRKINTGEVTEGCESFEVIINRAINNVYCTVYKFDTFDEIINKWRDIKYVDNIKTVYKSKEQ